MIFWEQCYAQRKEAFQGIRGLIDFFTHMNVMNPYNKAKCLEKRHKNKQLGKKSK